MLIDLFFTPAQFEVLVFAKKDAAGRTLYFPHGFWGSGYAVATEEQKRRILRDSVRTGDVVLAAFAVFSFAIAYFRVPVVYMLTAVPFIWMAMYLGARPAVRDLEKTPERLSHRDIGPAMTRYPKGRLLFIAMLASAVSAFNLVALLYAWSWWRLLMAVAFGLVAAQYSAWLYRHKG